MDSNILVIAVFIFSGAGAFSAIIGWIKSNEAFETKKFILGVLTGVFGGIALAIANAAGILNAVDETAQWILIGSLALSVVGIDNLRTGISAAVTNRAKEEKVEKKPEAK